MKLSDPIFVRHIRCNISGIDPVEHISHTTVNIGGSGVVKCSTERNNTTKLIVAIKWPTYKKEKQNIEILADSRTEIANHYRHNQRFHY